MRLDKVTLRRVFFGVAACIVLYWILHETERVEAVFQIAGGILAPFVFGAGLAFILNVPLRSIEGTLTFISNRSLRRAVAILLTFIVLLLVLTVVFWLLIPQVNQTAQTFASRLPAFFGNIQTQVIAFLEENPQLMEWIYANTDFESLDVANLIQRLIDMVGTSVTTIVSGTFTAIGGVTNALMNGFVGIVFGLYCLSRKEILASQGRRLIYAYLPESFCDETVRILRLTNETFSNFLSGQCLEVCILGILFAIAMAVFKMPYIPLVSVLVAVTAFIPVVGAFAGCFLGALFILVDDPILALWFVVMFLVIQQIEGNLIYPRVVGTSIGLPGMWVLFAVIVGGELFGVAGMFLMIPLVSVLYTLLGEYTAARLNTLDIPAEKLTAQPPEISSQLKKRRMRKAAEKNEQSKTAAVEDKKESE